MDHFAAVRDQRFADDLVLAIERELAVFDQVLQERGDVLGVHLAGVIGNAWTAD